MSLKTYYQPEQFGREYCIGGDLFEALSVRGFTDWSWGNDACPKFGSSSKRHGLYIWVDAKDPGQRELGRDHARFTVWECDSDGEPKGSGPAYEGEFMADLLAFLDEFIAAKAYAVGKKHVLRFLCWWGAGYATPQWQKENVKIVSSLYFCEGNGYDHHATGTVIALDVGGRADFTGPDGEHWVIRLPDGHI